MTLRTTLLLLVPTIFGIWLALRFAALVVCTVVSNGVCVAA